MTNQNLSIIIADSNLSEQDSLSIVNNFGSYEEIAKDWNTKAKSIVVTNNSQIAEMKMAREGRLFLREKRIAIEKMRKELKEQSLRRGQAIDAIARYLTSLIEPTEKYLQEQEDFVKIQEQKKADEIRIAEEKRLEEERIAKEKKMLEEQEKIRKENEQLKIIALEKEKELEEQKQAAKKLAEEQALRLKTEQEARQKAEKEIKDRAEKELQEKQKKEMEAQQLIEMESKKTDKEKFSKYISELLAIPAPKINAQELKMKINEIINFIKIKA